MVKIEYFYTDRMYKYLWLKYVTGTNLSVHCARCLLGEYEERIKAYMRSIYNLELRDAPVYYLCGVAYDRRDSTQSSCCFRPGGWPGDYYRQRFLQVEDCQCPTA